MQNDVKIGETVTISKAEYESLKQQISYLMDQLKLSQHRRYGASSEKSKYDQISLFAEAEAGQGQLFNEAETDAELAAPNPDIEEVKAYRRKKARNVGERIPPDLPVEIVEYELPDSERSCPECGGDLHVMGREARDELKLIPAKAAILRHVRHIYSCRSCEKEATQVPIVKADIPRPVIKGSIASPEAVAYIASQKFVMGIPLYRQEQEWERNGILLSRQTMSNWLIKATGDWLKPIYERLHELLCAEEVAHADETTVQVLREPGKAAQSKSYMWLYRTGGNAKRQIVLYDYQPSRSGKHPAAFLNSYTGYLHTDGYQVYHSGLPDRITVIGCWAHCRRKFDEALKIIPEKNRGDTETLRGKQYIDKLFALEHDYTKLPTDDHCKARYEARLKQSKPVMDEFFDWAENAGVLPKTPLGKAVKYALDQRQWLERVLLDGRLELSNNRAERSIKPFVIGRKNWLFSNTPKGADSSALLYSLVETAKENGLVPVDYLTSIFRCAPNLHNGHSIDSLLPWNLHHSLPHG